MSVLLLEDACRAIRRLEYYVQYEIPIRIWLEDSSRNRNGSTQPRGRWKCRCRHARHVLVFTQLTGQSTRTFQNHNVAIGTRRF